MGSRGNLVAVAAGLAQLARILATGRQVEPMQWISLGLVVVLGGATVLTQSPRFMMVRPTIVHLAVAVAMLWRGWMIRYLPEIVLQMCRYRRSWLRATPGRPSSPRWALLT
jgi:intracellular septation protein A